MKTSLELFTGAGGLALGLSRAGFSHVAVIERDAAACKTIRHNQTSGLQPVAHWHLREDDVTSIDFSAFKGVDLLAGGPPCQPFAISGKRRAHGDERNMFPEMIRAVREIQPPAVLIENVAGLLRGRLERYFEYVLLQLRFPTAERKTGETWPSHLVRLRRISHRAPSSGLAYTVHDRVLQAADFGVPQRRERVFIVAFRSDLGLAWRFPSATHSLDALLWEQWVSGDYWKRHSIPPRLRPQMAPLYTKRIERLRKASRPDSLPWRTIRDAMVGLPLAAAKGQAPEIENHILVPGARVYPNHTGSPLDMPSKTLKAGAHGVPGGENILVMPDGAIRYFTIRECARLQTFPDDYAFLGTWKSLVRQVGNAVPVTLVEHVGRMVHVQLSQRAGREPAVGPAVEAVSIPVEENRLSDASLLVH
jgi:DNA (cytosine-5)-methyltransferase 1